LLKIAEVRSRIIDLRKFIKLCYNLGFEMTEKEKTSHFILLEFVKIKDVKTKMNLVKINPLQILKPCVYKSR